MKKTPVSSSEVRKAYKLHNKIVDVFGDASSMVVEIALITTLVKFAEEKGFTKERAAELGSSVREQLEQKSIETVH